MINRIALKTFCLEFSRQMDGSNMSIKTARRKYGRKKNLVMVGNCMVTATGFQARSNKTKGGNWVWMMLTKIRY